MKTKQLSESILRWYTMALFHLKNMMFFPMTRNSFAVWKTLRRVNHANETAYKERLDNHNNDGDSWNFYSVSGGGIVADRTIVVPLNENVD